ncbi:MAG: lipopolysaccharide biosynthesis protein [Vibrionaceae bacterium]
MLIGTNTIAMIYYAGGLLLMKGLSLLMLPVLTHTLLPAEYSQLEILLTIINLGSLLLGFGLVDTLYRFVGAASCESERKAIAAKFFTLVWLIALIGSFILTAITPLVQSMLPLQTSLAQVHWTLFALPFEGVIGIPLAWLRMQGHARLFFFATAGKALLQALLTGLLLWEGFGVDGVLASGTLSAILLAIVLSYWQWKDCGISFDFQQYRALLRYSLPLVVSGIAGFMLSGLDRWLLAHSSFSHQLADYVVADKLALAASLLLQPFALWWYPHRFIFLHEPNGLEKTAYYSVLGAKLGFFTAGIVGFFAPTLITILTPSSYHGAITLIPFMVLSVALRNVSDLLNVGCFASKENKSQMYINLGCSALGGVGFFATISHFGIHGIIMTLLVVYCVRTFAFYYISQRLLPLPYSLKSLWGSVLFSFILIMLGQVLL